MAANLDLTEEIREVMASTFGVDESDLPEEVTPATFAPWTSLAHVTLILSLEERFGVTFEMDEMPELTSVPMILSALLQHHVR